MARECDFFAVDISSEALEIAQYNAKKVNIKNRITFVQSDLLTNLPQEVFLNKEVFIVANLPYIPSEVIPKMDESVRNFEPILALDGGKSGTELYEKLKTQIVERNIRPTLYMEIDPLIEEKIKEVFPKVNVAKDEYGNTRFARVKL
jgi:release factor glutamine methyltransferase